MVNQPRDIIGGVPFTGRTLVVYKHAKGDATSRNVKSLADKTGLKIAASSDFRDGAPETADLTSNGLYLEHLSVAVLPDQHDSSIAASLMSDDKDNVVATERE